MLYGAIPRIDASVLSEVLETFCTGCRNFAMLFFAFNGLLLGGCKGKRASQKLLKTEDSSI